MCICQPKLGDHWLSGPTLLLQGNLIDIINYTYIYKMKFWTILFPYKKCVTVELGDKELFDHPKIVP